MTNLNVHAAETADGLGTRLIVAYKQIPGNPMKALVIKMDSMKGDADRDELRHMVSTVEAQAERDFINILHRRNLLNMYHNKQYFADMDIDDVVMTPGNGQKIPLRNVINMLNERAGLAPLPTKDQLGNISTRDPLASAKKEELLQTGSKNAMAKNILIQAKLMQDEVFKKVKEALNLDPTVQPIADRILKGQKLEEPIKVEMEAPVKAKTKTKKTKKKVVSAQ